MIEWIIGLFIVGAVCIFLEAFVPGGILGFAGGICLLVGIVMAFIGFGAAGGLVSILAAALIVALTLYLEFKVLPKTWLGKRFFHTESNTETSNPEAAGRSRFVGRTGVTLTPLRPSGVILVDGRREEAFSSSGYLDRDAPVRIIAADAFKLIVVRATNSEAKPAGLS